MKTARFWQAGTDLSVTCRLCPHRCHLPEGARSRCYGRINQAGILQAATWGQPVAMAVDPIEKKPLYHFLPGTSVLSLGTLGCNLSCRFCQNWELSHPAGDRSPTRKPVLPEDVAEAALREKVPAVAATYNEPLVWAEYAMDLADACHAKGLRMVAVSSGYAEPETARAFFGKMDAANVDLKSFRDSFYQQQCGARLAPVLETLQIIRKETTCWLEVTTLLIPGLNDSDPEVDELTAWVAEHLGVDTPMHFTAFHPAGDLSNHPPTGMDSLQRARNRACQNGLHHVYLGNVHRNPECTATTCAACGSRLMDRDGFTAVRVGVTEDGTCRSCGAACCGIWQ
jgi:pyruvate formate lyase activating enzyme